MKKNVITFLFSLLIVSFFIHGFIMNCNNDPAGSKFKNGGVSTTATREVYSTPNTIIYTDDMDGANDTTSLKAPDRKV